MPLLSGILVLPYVLQPQNAVIIALHGKCLFLFSQVSHLIYLFLIYCGISDFFFSGFIFLLLGERPLVFFLIRFCQRQTWSIFSCLIKRFFCICSWENLVLTWTLSRLTFVLRLPTVEAVHGLVTSTVGYFSLLGEEATSFSFLTNVKIIVSKVLSASTLLLTRSSLVFFGFCLFWEV